MMTTSVVFETAYTIRLRESKISKAPRDGWSKAVVIGHNPYLCALPHTTLSAHCSAASLV